MSRQEPELPTPAKDRGKCDDVVLGRGVSDLPAIVNELQVVIDGVRRDDEFKGSICARSSTGIPRYLTA